MHTATANGDKGERVDKEHSDQSDHHEELGEVGVVWGRALKKMGGQQRHLAVHAIIHGSLEAWWTRFTTDVLERRKGGREGGRERAYGERERGGGGGGRRERRQRQRDVEGEGER